MNTISKQTKIISKLANLLHVSVPGIYDKAICEFKYGVGGDGSFSVGSKAWYELDGKIKSIFLNEGDEIDPTNIVPELHRVMMSHTGGEWDSFTLTLDKEGKATTKFNYPK